MEVLKNLEGCPDSILLSSEVDKWFIQQSQLNAIHNFCLDKIEVFPGFSDTIGIGICLGSCTPQSTVVPSPPIDDEFGASLMQD